MEVGWAGGAEICGWCAAYSIPDPKWVGFCGCGGVGSGVFYDVSISMLMVGMTVSVADVAALSVEVQRLNMAVSEEVELDRRLVELVRQLVELIQNLQIVPSIRTGVVPGVKALMSVVVLRGAIIESLESEVAALSSKRDVAVVVVGRLKSQREM